MAKKNNIKIENLPTRTPFKRRRKVCPFSGDNGLTIDYKDPKLLQRYMSEKGKIVPSRITHASQLYPVKSRESWPAPLNARASWRSCPMNASKETYHGSYSIRTRRKAWSYGRRC